MKIVITGASRGIGAAIAATMAKKGYKVVGTATSSAGATKINSEIGSQPFPLKGNIPHS